MRPITKTGEFTNANWDQMGVRIQAALVTLGVRGVQVMRDKVADPIVTGRTINSITWQTAVKGSAPKKPAKKENILAPPTDPYTVSIGSKEPSLFYREKGSGRHETSEGTQEFIDSMKEWAWLVLGINADGPPEDRNSFWRIIKHIRDNGTEARPFLDATRLEMEPIAVNIISRAIRKYMKEEAAKAARR